MPRVNIESSRNEKNSLNAQIEQVPEGMREVLSGYSAVCGEYHKPGYNGRLP